MANGGDGPFLPQEIILDILKRLPVKSLVRFQCVCKEWKNLFKTPSFIAEHLHHSDRKNPFLLLHEYRSRSVSLLNQNMETVEILSIPFRRGSEIIGSCNGLLFLKTNLYPCQPPYLLYRPPYLLYLWNPATRNVREIPQTTNDYWRICVFGFGFSSTDNDYKIVKVYNQELRKKKEEDQDINVAFRGHDGVEVYSLSTGLWKELEFGALQNITFRTRTAVSADGTMVWLGKKDLNNVLVSFDIVTEAFTITPIDGFSPTALGVWEDKFAIFLYSEYNAADVRLRLLEQVASESGKSLRCTDEYSIGIFSRALHSLCIWRNKILFNGIGIGSEAEPEIEYFLDLFNLSTKKWERLPNHFSAFDRFEGFNYERSLVSVSDCNTQVVVSFDIGSQVFTLTPISFPFKRADFPMISLGLYQNKFAIFHHYRNDSWNTIDIGVMEEVTGESGKSFRCIDRYDIGSMEYFFDFLCIWRDELVFREADKLKLFNVTTYY